MWHCPEGNWRLNGNKFWQRCIRIGWICTGYVSCGRKGRTKFKCCWFGLNKFTVPPLLCHHPPPATGRDDDEAKIKEILDDTLLKLGYLTSEERRANRILCRPDNKIGSCLSKLIGSNEKYHLFLITILFSSYQDAGLVHSLKYRRWWSRELVSSCFNWSYWRCHQKREATWTSNKSVFSGYICKTLACHWMWNVSEWYEFIRTSCSIHKMVWPPGTFPGKRFRKEHNICLTQRNNEAMYWHLSCFPSGTTWWASRLPAFASSCQILCGLFVYQWSKFLRALL